MAKHNMIFCTTFDDVSCSQCWQYYLKWGWAIKSLLLCPCLLFSACFPSTVWPQQENRQKSCQSASCIPCSFYIQLVSFFWSPCPIALVLSSPVPAVPCKALSWAKQLPPREVIKRFSREEIWMPFSTQMPKAAVLVHLEDNIKTRKSHFLHINQKLKRRLGKKTSLTRFSESREESAPGLGYSSFPSPTCSFDLVIAENKRMQVASILASSWFCPWRNGCGTKQSHRWKQYAPALPMKTAGEDNIF